MEIKGYDHIYLYGNLNKTFLIIYVAPRFSFNNLKFPTTSLEGFFASNRDLKSLCGTIPLVEKDNKGEFEKEYEGKFILFD